jgi:hypothetical protein
MMSKNSDSPKEKITHASYPEGLALALKSLTQLRKNSMWGLILPLPLILVSFWGFSKFDAVWYKDPFLGGIALVFIVGQIFAVIQHRSFLRGAGKIDSCLQAISGFPRVSMSSMVESLRRLPDGHFRDLLLRIARPLQSGDASLAQNLLDSAANRRMLHENRRMAQHSSINRTILKLGFLGTLIGLLLTFPPMKDAMLSLTGSEGEMKFVTHIAKALDGDRFAIFATLIATGLSMLIELLTISLLERGFARFETVNSLTEEWLLSESTVEVGKDPASWNGNMAEMQNQIYRNLAELAEMVRRTSRRIEDVREIQDSLEHRMDRTYDMSKDSGGKG